MEDNKPTAVNPTIQQAFQEVKNCLEMKGDAPAIEVIAQKVGISTVDFLKYLDNDNKMPPGLPMLLLKIYGLRIVSFKEIKPHVVILNKRQLRGEG